MKRFSFAAGSVALLAIVGAASAASLFPDFPIVGGASYCASNTVAGVPGTTAVCISTVPAGPTTYTGNEQVLAGLASGGTGAGGAASNVVIPGPALALGARVDQTTVGTTQTIPALTPYFFLDGAQGSALTVTMPAAPLDGYVQRIFCTAATVGVVTVAANTGQSIKNNPNAACTAGVGYAWIYNAANTTWYRFQ